MSVSQPQKKQAQAAIEYLLLLTAVVVIVLLAFNSVITKHQNEENAYFTNFSRGILGEPVGNGLHKFGVAYP